MSIPMTSALNRYLQSWDVSNLFVLGASAFPQNPGYNPTLTVGALAYWAAKAIRDKYLKNPGRLDGCPATREPSARGSPALLFSRRYPATASEYRSTGVRRIEQRKVSCGSVRLFKLPHDTRQQPAVCWRATDRNSFRRISWPRISHLIAGDQNRKPGATKRSTERSGKGLRRRWVDLLYPAMPYTAYTKMSREDVLAIRAYCKTINLGQQLCRSRTRLPFPFDIRASMRMWDTLYFNGRANTNRTLGSQRNGTAARSSWTAPVTAAPAIHPRRFWEATRLTNTCAAASCKDGRRPTSPAILASASVLSGSADDPQRPIWKSATTGCRGGHGGTDG